MNANTLRFLLPFVISAALLLVVANSVRGESDQLAAALGAADWRLIIPAIALYFIGVWLRSVGEAETLSALATFAYEHPLCPFPQLVDSGPLFEADALVHRTQWRLNVRCHAHVTYAAS